MKERIDILLVERRLVESRTKAQWLIRNGYVIVNGVIINKPSKRIDNLLTIELKHEYPYVGRGGLKLAAAINEFEINVTDKICADIGASIGGFTDCLLKHGASKVYAIDTAIDLLHPSLQCKDHVIQLLGQDARELNSLEEKVDIVTIDITFATLKEILPRTKNFLKIEGDIIALVKPLFETEFYGEKKFNIIKEYRKLYEILSDLINWSKLNKIFPINIIRSPLLGKGGSIEFFLHYKLENKYTNLYLEGKVKKILKSS